MTEPLDAAATPRPRSRVFRSVAKTKLSHESAKRQGAITTLAFRLLGGSEAAIAMLNSPHVELGGRPLDLAIASDEGYASVERAIRRLADPMSVDE